MNEHLAFNEIWHEHTWKKSKNMNKHLAFIFTSFEF